jgi:hypothetical protein
MIFQIKRLFLKDRKNILSRPNQMDKDDKIIYIEELAVSLKKQHNHYDFFLNHKKRCDL